VQAAIDRAVDGDRVVVQPGTYRERLDFRGKGIAVESAAGPEVTVLDGGGVDTVVRFVSGERQTSVLRGFTITGGVSRSSGGGIRVANGSPAIVGNVITGNRAPSGGGGISLSDSSALIQGNRIIGNEAAFDGGGIVVASGSMVLIEGNEIADNTAALGGGIALSSSLRTRIQYNTLHGNRATSDFVGGGGIGLFDTLLPEIRGNLVYGNAAPVGGGISWRLPENVTGPTMVANTFADNDSAMGSAVATNAPGSLAALIDNVFVARGDQTAILCIAFDQRFLPEFFFNTIWSPRGSAIGGVCDPAVIEEGRNLSVDPRFVDPAHGNYRLAADSPAIDAGEPLDRGLLPSGDLDRNPRILDGDGDGRAIVDQGAYELQP
jgi:parallel beta-helix repeat protein